MAVDTPATDRLEPLMVKVLLAPMSARLIWVLLALTVPEQVEQA